MDYKIYLRFLVFMMTFLCTIHGYKINITKFENCQDQLFDDEVFPVELVSVEYENIDGLVDTIHGTYIVRTIDTRNKELMITIFKCPTNSPGQCNSNPTYFTERLHCERFHGDDSGPWYMLSSAMSGSKCGDSTGTFTLDNAQLKPEYLFNYIVEDTENTRYRLRMLFHKKDEALDDLHIRGCVSLEFDLIY